MQAYYQAQLEQFWDTNEDEILGTLTSFHVQALEHLQTRAWQNQISYLKQQLEQHWKGKIYFEFKIPRMGKRADCILFINSCVFVLEFKVGSSSFDRFAIDQAYDYALDLKNFHLGSHDLLIFPIVVATKANTASTNQIQIAKDLVAKPFLIGELGLNSLIKDCLAAAHTSSHAGFTVAEVWEKSGYMPTPTIVEAAQALYKSHNVEDIARSDSGAKNLSETTDEIFKIIERSKILGRKSICFVTGVPGAGKTLAGLNIATSRSVKKEEHAVFLSGNGPLVEVLREALARDKVVSEKVKKKDAQREVSSFIHFGIEFKKEAGQTLATIRLTGDIVSGDYDEFLSLTQIIKQKNAIFHSLFLESNGGSVAEALQIGRYVRANGIWTRPWEDGQSYDCKSACALIYLGGVVRSTGNVGVHRSYFKKNGSNQSDKLSFSSMASALDENHKQVVSYLREIRVDEDVIAAFLQTSSQSMTKITVGLDRLYEEYQNARCGRRPNLTYPGGMPDNWMCIEPMTTYPKGVAFNISGDEMIEYKLDAVTKRLCKKWDDYMDWNVFETPQYKKYQQCSMTALKDAQLELQYGK
ncbi:DNA/RNA helicase domain-containing protein [Rhodobacterales bacterium FZCC0083]|nr:DNA/RNA helicase domain-containing protein [Rhodobacterales bacterium FZCC0083]